MLLPRNVGVHVSCTEPIDLRFLDAIRLRWMEAGFDRPACRRIVEDALSASDPSARFFADLLDPSAIERGGRIATERLLHPALPWCLKIVKRSGDRLEFREVVELSKTDRDLVGRILRLLTSSDDEAALRTLGGGLLSKEAQRIVTAGAGRAPSERWAPAKKPGIYRREHGSILIRSESTSLLFDPVAFWTQFSDAPTDIDPEVDAVLITHGHADHFNIASIIHAGRTGAKVIVPPVPKPNLLSPCDMRAALGAFGQDAIDPPWWSTIEIGDIAIDVLPFYGEQPTGEGLEIRSPLRNFGSCYRIETPSFSVLTLIDSGAEPGASMVDVAKRSVEARGPFDVVMSSLPRFFSPFFSGLPLDYLTLSFEELEALDAIRRAGKLPSVTPGAPGVAEICEAARARTYLPYGNGFEGVGRPIEDVAIGMGEPPESTCVSALDALLEARGGTTRAVVWNPGDAFVDGRVVPAPI